MLFKYILENYLYYDYIIVLKTGMGLKIIYFYIKNYSNVYI